VTKDKVISGVLSAIELVHAERIGQIEREGYTPAHDDQYACEELAIAAACYAVHGTHTEVILSGSYDDAWPWEARFDKRKTHTRLRRLVIAAALLIAEIERVQRLPTLKGPGHSLVEPDPNCLNCGGVGGPDGSACQVCQ